MAAPVIALLPMTYSYKRSDASTFKTTYSYDIVSYGTSFSNIVYSYNANTSDRCPTLVGRWSDHTQRICNRLPYWHVGRRGGNGTNYQKMINTFGIVLEDLSYEMSNARRNLYIDTVDAFQLSSTYRTNLKVNLEEFNKHPSSNMLINSDFSIKGTAKYKLPYAWSDLKEASTAAVSCEEINDSVIGGNCITITATAGQTGYIHQRVNAEIPKGENVTLSAWVNIPVDDTISDTEDATVTSLYLSVIYVDGTEDSTRVALPITTMGYWKRISVTIELTKPSYTMAAMIKVDVPIGDRDHVVCVDALQLEVGAVATQWRDHVSDSPSWLNITSGLPNGPIDTHIVSPQSTAVVTIDSKNVSITTSQKRRLFYVDKISQFGDHSIPTAIQSMTDVSSSVPTTRATKKFGIYSDVIDKSSWPVVWRINPDDSAQIQKLTQGPLDVLGTYSIAERDIEQDGSTLYGVPVDHYPASHYTLQILDFSILNKNIWAFCKEVLDSVTFYTIKIISTDTHPALSYLEMINDIALSTTDAATIGGLGADISFIAHVDGDLNNIVISNGTNYYTIQLYFDYYMLALDKGQVLTRHNYTGDLVMT